MQNATLILLTLLLSPYVEATGGPRPRVSAAEAQELYDTFATLPAIDWTHAESGCFERARLMADVLSRRDIFSVKVFVEDPRGLRVHAATDAPGWEDSWRYHVAPALRDAHGDLIVLDPSLMTGPVTVERWLAALTPRPCERLTSFRRPLGTRCAWYETSSSQVHRPRSLGPNPDTDSPAARINGSRFSGF